MCPLSPEQWEEIERGFAASRAQSDALERKWRSDAGKFSIELIGADDDPPVNDRTFQEELSRFAATLRATKIPYGQRGMALDSVDAHGYPLPEFILAIKDIALPVVASLAAPFGAWMQAKYGRKVRLKIGETEAEARTVVEVEKLLKIAAEFTDHHQDGDDAK
jgi:hypothetical protein